MAQSSQSPFKVGQAINDFSLLDKDGKEHPISSLTGERYLLLVFLRHLA